VAGLADPQGQSPTVHMQVLLDITNIYYSLNLCQLRLQNATNMAGVAGTIAAVAAGSASPVGFIVGPIIGGALFAKWVYDTYRAT